MVYLKAIQKITPKDVAVSGTIDEETYLKKFRGGFSPLSPPPGSAYDICRSWIFDKKIILLSKHNHLYR